MDNNPRDILGSCHIFNMGPVLRKQTEETLIFGVCYHYLRKTSIKTPLGFFSLEISSNSQVKSFTTIHFMIVSNSLVDRLITPRG